MNLKQTYNRIAEDWHQDHQADDWWVNGTDKFISFLKPGSLVLDVGCASGLKSKYFLENGLQVVGIDFSEKMIEIARRESPAGKFLVLGLEEADKLEYLFDGIFMQAVLLHIPKKEVADDLRKVMEKLKPGGYLYIAIKEKKLQGEEEEIKIESDYGYSYERFFSYFTVAEIESYLRNLGLEIVFSKVDSSENTNWVQVIGRK